MEKIKALTFWFVKWLFVRFGSALTWIMLACLTIISTYFSTSFKIFCITRWIKARSSVFLLYILQMLDLAVKLKRYLKGRKTTASLLFLQWQTKQKWKLLDAPCCVRVGRQNWKEQKHCSLTVGKRKEQPDSCQSVQPHVRNHHCSSQVIFSENWTSSSRQMLLLFFTVALWS